MGGTTVNVAVQAGDDLQAFADRINGTTDVGASASVINNRLVLISKESGSASTITVGGTAAAGFGFATTQNGTDAAATVNGLAVTSSGNVIEARRFFALVASNDAEFADVRQRLAALGR